MMIYTSGVVTLHFVNKLIISINDTFANKHVVVNIINILFIQT